MSRARDLANLGDINASDITTGTFSSSLIPNLAGDKITSGTLSNTVQDNITRLGTVTTGTFNGTLGAGMVVNVASHSATDSINTSANNGYAHAVELLAVSWQLKTTNPLLVAYFHTQTGTQNGTASWKLDFNYDTNTTNSGFSYSSANLFSGDSTNGSFYSYYSDSDGDRRRAKILQSAKVITGTAGHYCEVQCEAWGGHSKANEYYGFKTITVFEVAQ